MDDRRRYQSLSLGLTHKTEHVVGACIPLKPLVDALDKNNND